MKPNKTFFILLIVLTINNLSAQSYYPNIELNKDIRKRIKSHLEGMNRNTSCGESYDPTNRDKENFIAMGDTAKKYIVERLNWYELNNLESSNLESFFYFLREKLRLLGLFKDRDTTLIPIITPYIEHNNYIIVSFAIEALLGIGSNKALPYIESALIDSKNKSDSSETLPYLNRSRRFNNSRDNNRICHYYISAISFFSEKSSLPVLHQFIEQNKDDDELNNRIKEAKKAITLIERYHKNDTSRIAVLKKHLYDVCLDENEWALRKIEQSNNKKDLPLVKEFYQKWVNSDNYKKYYHSQPVTPYKFRILNLRKQLGDDEVKAILSKHKYRSEE